jgi:hypothetical protein
MIEFYKELISALGDCLTKNNACEEGYIHKSKESYFLYYSWSSLRPADTVFDG